MDMPINDYKQIILKILDTVEYSDDKESFVDQFAGIIYLQSVADLIQSLPVGDQENIKQEMSASDNNSEKIEEVMKKYFTEEQKTKAIELAAESAIVDYLKSIDDSLSSTQKQKLTEFFQTFTPPAD